MLLLCCIARGKSNVSRVSLQGFAVSMCTSGLMVNESEFRYSDSVSFPERRDYEFTFQFFGGF